MEGKAEIIIKNMSNSAIKILEDLSFEEKQKKYPDQPYLIRKKFSDKTANGLTKSIIAYIKLKGGQAERISTTGRVLDGRKTYTDTVGFRRTIGSTKWIPGTGTKEVPTYRLQFPDAA